MSTPATLAIRDRAPVAAHSLMGIAELGGRVLLAALFLLAGFWKISGYGGTAAYMASMGVSPVLLPVVIATEVLGSLALIAGWHTRIAAFLLAGFSLLAAMIFHHHFADQTQLILFLSDVAAAGGLLTVVANGAGPLSLDRRRGR